MSKFDKKIKRLSKEFQVPETYYQKIDKIIGSIQEDQVVMPKKKPFVKVAAAIAALCILITGFFFFSSAEVAEASFFQTFRQSIMDFFGMGEEESQEMGIESKKEDAVSKPDLMMELQEVVMDTQSIYAVVKITAPPEVEFNKSMIFDYFGFCGGTNYNVSSEVPGTKNCTLLEVMKDKKNVATYVVNVATGEQIEEGKDVTVFFQNLLTGPYEDKPEILVEGMWSISFTAAYTNSKNITVKGTEDMKFSFAGATADIKGIKLLPLGMTVNTDVSRVDDEILRTTDTRFTVTMKMIDGSEVIVSSPNPDADCLAGGGEVSQSEKKGRVYLKYVYQFDKAIDINQVLGITISDYYVPLKEYGG